MWQELFKRKRIDELQSRETKLDRSVNNFQSFCNINLFSMGVGIFVLSGNIIGNQTGASAILCYMIAGTVMLVTSLSKLEFALQIPKAGSAFTYTLVVLGNLPAYLIGWIYLFDFILLAALAGKGASQAFDQMFDYKIRDWSRQNLYYLNCDKNCTILESLLSSEPDLLSLINLTTLFIINTLNVMLSFNIIIAFWAILMTAVIGINIASYAFFGGRGLIANYGSVTSFFAHGIKGFQKGITSCMFLFTGGEESLMQSTEEMKSNKSLLLIVGLNVFVTIVISISMCVALTYLIPYNEIITESPFASAFKKAGAPVWWVDVVGSFNVVICFLKISTFYVISRHLYAMASEGLFLPVFSLVSADNKVPYIGLIFGLIFGSLCAVFGNITVLADNFVMGVLFANVSVGVNLIIYRYLFNKNSKKQMPLRGNLENVSCCQILRSRMTFTFIFVLFVTFNFLLGSIFANQLYMISIIMLVIIIILFILLCLYQPDLDDSTYRTPLMPFCPALTISVNAIQFCGLLLLDYILMAFWLIAGISIYIYLFASNMMKKDECENLPLVDQKDQ